MGQIMIPDVVREYADDDIGAAIDYVNDVDPSREAEILSLDFSTNDDAASDREFTVYVEATIQWCAVGTRSGVKTMQLPITFEYVVEDDNVYTGGDVSEWGDDILDQIEAEEGRGTSVASSTRSRKQRIVAADEDDGFDDGFDDSAADDIIDDEGQGFTDTLDDMSDQLDEIQDTVDDVEEDEIDIEMENNIDGHYIAECDKCHGVFISAMIESDQAVDHISGTCPLCEKETDQYLKWVVKKVER